MGTIKLDNILYGYMVSDPAVFYPFSEHLNEVQCIRQSVCWKELQTEQLSGWAGAPAYCSHSSLQGESKK